MAQSPHQRRQSRLERNAQVRKDNQAKYSVPSTIPALETVVMRGIAELVVTELHYHRNGVAGTGYYAGRAHWRPDPKTLGFSVMFAAFIRAPDDNPEVEAEGHIAIMGNNDVGQSFRFEDFDAALRKFIFSRAGQFMAFPHTLVRA